MEELIDALEGKDVLTDSQMQSVIQISKMLETMCSEFKAYHYEIVAGLESDEEVALQQVVFDKHQKKTVGFIDRLADLLVKPQVSVPSSAFTNNCSVDRHLGFLAKSANH